MSGLKYLWQQAVVDAFAASPETLATKINIAERAIQARQKAQPQPDAFEHIAITEALRSLRTLVDEANAKSAQRTTHYHIRWAKGALDWERFSTTAEAEESARQLARPGEAYKIEEYDERCQQCRNFSGGMKTSNA